jgi:hypothetical protein
MPSTFLALHYHILFLLVKRWYAFGIVMAMMLGDHFDMMSVHGF